MSARRRSSRLSKACKGHENTRNGVPNGLEVTQLGRVARQRSCAKPTVRSRAKPTSVATRSVSTSASTAVMLQEDQKTAEAAPRKCLQRGLVLRCSGCLTELMAPLPGAKAACPVCRAGLSVYHRFQVPFDGRVPLLICLGEDGKELYREPRPSDLPLRGRQHRDGPNPGDVVVTITNMEQLLLCKGVRGCGRRFIDRKSLARHYARHHLSNRPATQQEVGFALDSLAAAIKHGLSSPRLGSNTFTSQWDHFPTEDLFIQLFSQDMLPDGSASANSAGPPSAPSGVSANKTQYEYSYDYDKCVHRVIMRGDRTEERLCALLQRPTDEWGWCRSFSGDANREEGQFCPVGPGCIEQHEIVASLRPVVTVEPDYVSGFWRFTLTMPRLRQ